MGNNRSANEPKQSIKTNKNSMEKDSKAQKYATVVYFFWMLIDVTLLFYLFIFKINLFIFGCVGSLLLRADFL